MALTTKRIIALPSQTDPQEGDYLAIDNLQGGTHKIPVGRVGVEVDDTLTEAGKAADAKAVGDALDEIRSQIEVTGTASGAIATFTDGAEMPAKSVVVNIEPQQSGTGTPSPDNVRQISGWESVSVGVSGKNFFPRIDSGTKNGITATVNSDGSVTLVGTATASTSFYKTFTLKAGTYIITDGRPNADAVTYLNGVSGSTSENARLTIPNDIETQAVVLVYNGRTVNQTLYPMLRLASDTDPTYEPYTGTTTTTPLGRTVYGGEAEIVGGSLTDKMGMIDLGDINWRQVGSTSVFYASPAYSSVVGTIKCDSTSRDFVANAICSQYAVVSRNAMDSSNNCVAINKSDTTYISVKDSRYTDVTAFKTAMSGVKFCYELATPQTYTLTPTEIQTLLGENNVWADSGDVEVVYVRDLNIAINNLLSGSGTRSLGMMAMSAPTKDTAEEPTDEQTEEPAEDDMR